MSTAAHAQTDGQMERVNQVLETMLRAMCNNNQNDWKQLLPQAEHAYNSRSNGSTQHSPFYANYGFRPRTAADMAFDTISDEPTTKETLKRLKRVNAKIQDNIEFAQLCMIESHDKKVTEPDIKVNDQVMLSTRLTTPPYLQNRSNSSLQHKWSGPYKVLALVGKNAYRLELPATMHIHPVISLAYLKKYKMSDKFTNCVLQLPPPVQVDGHLEYYPERVVSHRIQRKKQEYLVHWEGYSEHERTWELADNLSKNKKLIDEYKRINSLK